MTADPAEPRTGQPAVRGNDWRSLDVDEITPTRSVTVVVPAFDAHRTLPYTLAALAAQTYPAELLEVVVVDDGSSPALELPELRPERTRLVRTSRSWGRAHACHTGALAAEGEVLHWLDADMLPAPDEVERQLRWHHVLDHAVVLGHKTFVDLGAAPGALPELDEVVTALRAGRPDDLFRDWSTAPHEWVEEHLDRTDGLTKDPTKSYLVHVGASASVRREVYLDAGGMDERLKLGEDVEMGYRLAQQGCVFVPDEQARSWHLGRSTLMRQQDVVNRYNRPFIIDRVADLRSWRTKGRIYSVPYVEVVLDVGDHAFEDVRGSVEAVLTGTIADVQVALVGGWSRLEDTRRSPLADPDLTLRLLQAALCGDPRVRFVEAVPETAFPAPYRLLLPAGWCPGRDTLRKLAGEMSRKDRGLVSVLHPDGRITRLERTSAFARARRLRPGAGTADLDELVDEVSGTWWFDSVEEGFATAEQLAAEQAERAQKPARRVQPKPTGRPAPAATAAQPPATPAERAEPAGPGRLARALRVRRRSRR